MRQIVAKIVVCSFISMIACPPMTVESTEIGNAEQVQQITMEEVAQ